MKLHSACVALLLAATTTTAIAQVSAIKRPARTNTAVVPSSTNRGGGPANDDCASVVPEALAPGVPLIFTGDNTGATLDDPALTDPNQVEYPAVWESFSTTTCMDITVSFCGSLFVGVEFSSLFADCDLAGIVRAVDGDNTLCPDERFTFTFRRVPAGNYLIPIAADPDGTPGEYTVTVIGAACTDPAVASDECDGNDLLTVGTGCVATTVDVAGATESIPAAVCSGFTGTADEDVWFSFVANSTITVINVQPSAGFDAALEVFEGDCNGLTSLGCLDAGLDGELEGGQVSGLTVGNTYYFRVYDYYIGMPATTEIDVCVVEIPDVTPNNDCPGTSLVMGETCVSSFGTVAGATQSIPAAACAGNTGVADDDVWHSFVATATNVVVAAQGGADFDMVLELRSGTCGTSTILACADATLDGEVEQAVFGGLTVGNTYYIRLYSYTDVEPTEPTYSICVFGVASPANDECADAETIEVNEPVECPAASVIGNNAFAAVSTGDPSCDESTDGYSDVWYTFNSLGNSVVTVNYESFSQSDWGVVVTESCTAGVDVACEIAPTAPFDVDVEPNTDYLVRVYSNLQFGSGGEFALCVSGVISTGVETAVVSPWSVFPNPNDGRFQVVNSGSAMNAYVELFDATGRVVLNERVNMPQGGMHTFEQADRLAPGTYALRITSGDNRYEQRLMVR